MIWARSFRAARAPSARTRGALGEAGQGLRPVGLEAVDRSPAICAVLARDANREHLPLTPLGGALHHSGHARVHIRMDILRHERIVQVMPLVVRPALLLERLAQLRHLLPFDDAPQLIRGDQAFCHSGTPCRLSRSQAPRPRLSLPVFSQRTWSSLAAPENWSLINPEPLRPAQHTRPPEALQRTVLRIARWRNDRVAPHRDASRPRETRDGEYVTVNYVLGRTCGRSGPASVIDGD